MSTGYVIRVIQRRIKAPSHHCHVRSILVLVFAQPSFSELKPELVVHHSEHALEFVVIRSEQMLWASKRRKSRPDIPPSSKSASPSTSLPQRRSSLGSPRLPFAPLDPHQPNDMHDHDPKSLYGRPILTPDEQQRLARQNSP